MIGMLTSLLLSAAAAPTVTPTVPPDTDQSAIVVVAARATKEILFPFLGEHHGFALAAFVPQIVGALALGEKGDAATDPAQPTHGNRPQILFGRRVTPTTPNCLQRRGNRP